MCGKIAVLEAGEEHDRELQALGRVQGHQGDDALLSPSSSGIWSASATSDTCSRKSARVPSGLASSNSRQTASSSREVLDPGLVLRVVGRPQLGEVAGLLQHGLEHRRRPGASLDQRTQRLHRAG